MLARIRAWKNVAHVLIDSNVSANRSCESLLPCPTSYAHYYLRFSMCLLQLFGDAMNNLALIMFVTGGCLLLQFTMLVLRFVADTTNAKYSSVSYE